MLTENHLKELELAVHLLENPGITAKITNLLGTPVEKGLSYLPKNWNEKIVEITKTALLKVTETAVFTLQDTPLMKSSNWWHKAGVATSGAVGGFFGLAALAIELPVSTGIMLRSIADIARSEGENISDFNTQMACLEVFALGSKKSSDDASEMGYFAVRSALSKTITEASEYVLTKGLTKETAPAMIQFLVKIAQRFSITVTEKAAAQAIPAIGAVGGALINTLFMDHFQDMAKGHFTVRKLERIYGKTLINTEYLRIMNVEK